MTERCCKPLRIQRKRSKGWKVESPNGLPVVYVGRGSRWGNPFVVGKDGDLESVLDKYYRQLIPYQKHSDGLTACLISESNVMDIKKALAGKNLMCWCRLDCKCHADILLKIANDW